ncbi:hypothetical protein SEA_OHGEESY_52 [Gordonia phage Ohgeesy]|uniref:Uncharacterized protein n=1 Tax=Gordonia phage Ohgeesy TaxID=2762412 RepID=A0A7G8LGA9_9CAUD|nr:hypothetical protein PP492_gp52 [Gordonia phage Ohgeesy]QNJ56281.1 hypothetical protein SEA_OHGEESY_52 [Gordonia phage Ohgeesy]
MSDREFRAQLVHETTLGDLGAFIRECEGEGWTPDASVTFHQQHGDRPGELSTYSLRVSETR